MCAVGARFNAIELMCVDRPVYMYSSVTFYTESCAKSNADLARWRCRRIRILRNLSGVVGLVSLVVNLLVDDDAVEEHPPNNFE